MDLIGLKSKKDLRWFQDERLTTEFQAKYYDRLTNFRINIKSEEDRLLRQTLMRIKSIKIQDNYNTLSFNQDVDTKEGLFVKNKQKTPTEQLEANDVESRLEREKMIILKKFQKNSIENVKKISYLSQSLKTNSFRSKTTLKQINDEKIKNNLNKKDSYRPKTVKPQKNFFNESVDGSRIPIKNIQNDDNKTLNELSQQPRADNHDNNQENLSNRSISFPRISNNQTNPSLNYSPTSGRHEKSSKLSKQPLKTKSAKLLFCDQSELFHNSWYSNDYGKWFVDEETKQKYLRENKKRKTYHKRELKAVINYSLQDPPTSPTSQFYDNDSIKSRSRPITGSRTIKEKTPSSVIINKISKTDENRMNINDLIKYMKPIDNQPFESKSIETFTENINNNEKFKISNNLPEPIIPKYNYEDNNITKTINNELPDININNNNNELKIEKSEKYELSIKIPLDNYHNN